MKNKTELPMMFARAGVVAKVVAVSSGVLGSLALFTCVVPELRESHERFQIAMLILFVASVSVSAICAGIVRSGEAPRKRSKVKSILVRVAPYLLLFMGLFFLTEGHVYHVKAKGRKSQQDMLLARDGYCENPYWEKQLLCDFLGVVCLGSCGLWLWSAFLFKLAESTANVCRKSKSQSKGINS